MTSIKQRYENACELTLNMVVMCCVCGRCDYISRSIGRFRHTCSSKSSLDYKKNNIVLTPALLLSSQMCSTEWGLFLSLSCFPYAVNDLGWIEDCDQLHINDRIVRKLSISPRCLYSQISWVKQQIILSSKQHTLP